MRSGFENTQRFRRYTNYRLWSHEPLPEASASPSSAAKCYQYFDPAAEAKLAKTTGQEWRKKEEEEIRSVNRMQNCN